jgi:hypothetical protein
MNRNYNTAAIQKHDDKGINRHGDKLPVPVLLRDKLNFVNDKQGGGGGEGEGFEFPMYYETN